MHHIHLTEGTRLRFPARSADFSQGVEIGMLAALMSQNTADFTRLISGDNVAQARALAEQLGYRIVEGVADGPWVELSFCNRAARPRLRVVHSRS